MKIYQSATTTDPTLPDQLVTKRYVDQQIVSGAVVGGVFITNISPTSSGIVGNKVYVSGTVPANAVISEATSDTANVRVSLVAEGGTSFYSPTITVTTVPAQAGGPITVTLTEDTYDKRLFSGYADIVLGSQDMTVTATSSTNAADSVVVHPAAAGPVAQSVTIGSLPGSQTEVKNNDVVQVSGVVDNTATYAEIIVAGAAKAISSLTLGANDSASAGFKTVTGTFVVGSGTGAQTVTLRARNALGTYGSNVVSGNTVTLNQTFPSIGARTITYPGGQSALKGTDTATVASTITNADTVVYSSSADLSITNPNTYQATKTVTRVSGNYVVGTNNYTITATKASNGAVTVANSAISIADAAPTASISIVGNPARLVSSAAGQSYTVSITPTQLLNTAPSLSASSGTWQGNWVFSAGSYTRVLLVTDTDAKGSQLFSSLSLNNIANVAGSTITAGSAYTVGGFTRRTLTVPAFSQLVAIGTNVVTIAKTNATYSGAQSALTLQNSTAQFQGGYTITDSNGTYNPTGNYMFITDADFAGSNTSGTLQVEIEEVA